MDPITTTAAIITALSTTMTMALQAAMEVAVKETLDEKVAKKEIRTAVTATIEQTIQAAKNPSRVQLIISSIIDSIKPTTQESFQAEIKKILLLSDQPNINTIVNLCMRHIDFQTGLKPVTPKITREEVTVVWDGFLAKLRSNLLDQPVIKRLFIPSETLRVEQSQLHIDEDQLSVQREMLYYTQQIAKTRQTSPNKRLDFFAHITHPPAHYVERSDFKKLLANELITRQHPIVLHGIGGIGKSTVARSLCEMPEIQKHFADGVLMVELGQQANLVQKLAELTSQLEGIPAAPNLSIPILKNRLAELVAGKQLLLILDNGWTYEQVDMFNVLRDKAQLLVTTRQGGIAEKLGVSIMTCPGMTHTEGQELLSKWSGNKRNDAHDDQRNLLQKLGYHPLAIKLAGAQLKRQPHLLIETWLSNFNTKGLTLEPVGNAYDSLKLTFELSLELLNDDKRILYRQLGIFTEDSNIPAAIVKGIWTQLSPNRSIHTTEFLHELINLALVNDADNDDHRMLRLHPLLQDYLRNEITAEELQEANQAVVTFLDLVRQADGHPDGELIKTYFYESYVSHLAQAGMYSKLYSLLIDSPDWWHEKLTNAKHTATYVDDIEIAISSFAEPISMEQLIILVKLYAARATAWRSSSEHSDEELQVLTYLGRTDEALRFASLRSGPKKCFKGVLAIQKILKQQNKPILELYQLQAISKLITEAEERVRATLELIEFFSGQVIENQIDNLYSLALDYATQEPNDNYRIRDILLVAESMILHGKSDEARTLVDKIISESMILLYDTFVDEIISELWDLKKYYSSARSKLLELAVLLKCPQSQLEYLRDQLLRVATAEHKKYLLPSFAAEILRAGFVSDAERVIDQIDNSYDKVVAFGNMLVVAVTQRKLEDVERYFTRAVVEINHLRSEDTRVADSATHMFVGALVHANEFYRASSLTSRIEHPYWQNLAIDYIVQGLVKQNLFLDAYRHYQNRNSIELPENSKTRLMLALSAAEHGYSQLADMLLSKPEPDGYDRVGSPIANHISAIIHVLIRQGKLIQAEKMTNHVRDEGMKIGLLARIAFAHFGEGNHPEAIRLGEIADAIKPLEFDTTYVGSVAFLTMIWAYFGEKDRSLACYQRAKTAAMNLSQLTGRCWAIGELIHYAYLTGSILPDVWNDAVTIATAETDCHQTIWRNLSGILDLDKDEEIAYEIIAGYKDDTFNDTFPLELLAKNAKDHDKNHLIDVILAKLKSMSEKTQEGKSAILSSWVEILIVTRNYESALTTARHIEHPMAQANAYAHIAISLLNEGDEPQARQIFARAKSISESIETFGQWSNSLSRWGAALMASGYQVEALAIYQPDIILDYTEIVSDWEEELRSLSTSLPEDLFFEIVTIYAWADREWATALEYFHTIHAT